MPLEIRELVIKVNVNESGGGTSTPSGRPAQASGGGGVDKKAIIAECLEQVMDVLQKKKER